jgi:hypothetical protein
MLLPSSWNRLKRKRLAVIEDDCHEVQQTCKATDVDVSHLKGIVARHLQQGSRASTDNDDWQWLLSKMSIAKMLQSTGEPSTQRIPIVTRKYEEAFMRECKNDNEKPCVFQAQSECMKINTANAFVGV